MTNEGGKTSIGLDENVAALLCYVLGWVSGLVLFLVEKDNDAVRFHAMQSMITFGGVTILSIVFGALYMPGLWLSQIIGLLGIAMWILLMVKAYQGERYRLPVIGDIAEDWARRLAL